MVNYDANILLTMQLSHSSKMKTSITNEVNKFITFSDHSFNNRSDDFNISVTPIFITNSHKNRDIEISDAKQQDGKYHWVYAVIITNYNKYPFKLIARKWTIVESSGSITTVNGLGVVGQSPIIDPHSSFEYFSNVSLKTNAGMMYGFYTMVNCLTGIPIIIQTPCFTLESIESISTLLPN